MRSLSTRPAQRGFTLVEILVTVVLISVGLLGVAALQLTTLRGNQEAYVRSQASILAADILDRMRANPIAFRNGAYDVDFNGTGTGAGQAFNDLTTWQQTINTTLPGGAENAAGRIVRTQALSGRHIVTVTIRWIQRSEGKRTTDTVTDTDISSEFSTRSEI
ncbi:type IV pilus modification protein PilV [Steroidobacter sp.]|uniref:type IV pilus modification protein PilV n=1 Tax=Steroidobacter sp. TaxID=1978227 RepID=UPI001A61B3C2|nr:type IV pilus modification protein PilV [Steroidobacter sp.]MBL8268258.1 type IV pilus modification protein PilV [Steroidobacter sp.]